MKTVIQTYKMMFGRNPLTAASLLIFWMNIFRAESCHRSEYLSIWNECCSMCPPGSGLKIHTACTTTSDTVCEPLEGFYCLDSTGSGCMTAQEHTRCKPGQYISQNGTALTDTVCSECSDGTYSDGTLTSCWTHTQCGPLEIKPGTASTDAECGEQSSNTMTVVGVVGIVVLLFLCGAAVFVFCHRKKKIKKDTKEIQKFPIWNISQKTIQMEISSRSAGGTLKTALIQATPSLLCPSWNVMLLGDFNTDCGYHAKKNRKNVRLITQKGLFWLIPDKTDTTVRSTTSCTYDRIVVHGESFARAVVPLSAKPFNFQMEYRLTEEQALQFSDHYPVEVLLKEVKSSPNSGALSLPGTKEIANQRTKFFSLFVLSHLVFRMLTC